MSASADGRSIDEFDRKLFFQFFWNVWSARFQIVYLVDAWPSLKDLKSSAVRILVWERALEEQVESKE
jgi:hypothetical protein